MGCYTLSHQADVPNIVSLASCVTRPLELSRLATMKAALQFLHEAGIVEGSWLSDSDVDLLFRQQDCSESRAVALAEAGFKAMQTSRQSG